MNMQLYSIYDRKTNVYSPPMVCHNDGHAKRDLMGTLKKPGTLLEQFPNDYDLVSIGSWSDNDAKIVAHQTRVVCNLSALMPEAGSAE